MNGWRARSARLRTGVASSRVRFEQRAAEVRRRPQRAIAWGASAAALVLVLGWVFFMSPLLAVEEVSVEGAPPDATTAVVAAAGIAVGTPLARVDGTAVAARVERDLSWVDEVKVIRQWPRAVVVAVTPRVPVLAFRGSDGAYTLIDKDAVLFETVPTLPAGVVLVTPASATPDVDGVRAVLEILDRLSPQQRASVSNVRIASASSVSFMIGKVDVIWGGPGELDKKLKVLAILLGTNPAVVDVSTPDTPVTR